MSFSLSNIFSNLKKTSEKTNSGSVVGIDVGGSAVKVVEIEETPKTIMLRTYGELQLGPYAEKALGEVVVLDPLKKMEAITDVLREAGVNSKEGYLAMPLSSSFLTVIPIVLNGQENIASRIPVEARKYVPLPLTDVTLDWSELTSPDVKNASTHEVLLAAIENKALTEQRELLRSLNIVGDVNEIEAFGLIRSLWRSGDTVSAIIDIGARSTKLYIVRNGILERLHRVVIGGKEITNALGKKLNISFEEAESLKRSYNRNEEQGAMIFDTMTNILNSPLSEFARSINQYESRFGISIDRVVISGGVANTPYCLDYIRDKLGKSIESADPFAKVAYPAFMEDTLKMIGPSFGVALGAALRKFQ